MISNDEHLKTCDKLNSNTFEYLINNELEEINVLDVSDNKEESIKLKSHEDIYLEIYKAAKLKAKQIRRNAVQAFIDAKNIKNKYNLPDCDTSDSSDEEENFVSS